MVTSMTNSTNLKQKNEFFPQESENKITNENQQPTNTTSPILNTQTKQVYAPQNNYSHNFLENLESQMHSNHLSRKEIEHAIKNGRRDFHGLELKYVNLSGLDLSNTNFDEADLSYCNLKDTKLYNATFHNVNIYKAELGRKQLVHFVNNGKTNFIGVNCSGADLSALQFPLGTDFSGADFSDAILTGTDFSKSILNAYTTFDEDKIEKILFRGRCLKEQKDLLKTFFIEYKKIINTGFVSSFFSEFGTSLEQIAKENSSLAMLKLLQHMNREPYSNSAKAWKKTCENFKEQQLQSLNKKI